MDEITIGDKVYVSSKRAAKITGYAKDYVGQLCREGRVEARLVGRNWYVLESALREHRFGKPEEEGQEAPEPSAPEAAGSMDTWKPPQYEPETPRYVPEFAPKPAAEVPAGIPAVADMQSAWREWFEERPKAPVASQESFEEEPEEVLIEERMEEEVIISRITAPAEEPEEPEEEEEVEIHRSYASRETVREAFERIPANEMPAVVDLSPRPQPATRQLRRKEARIRKPEKKSGSMVTRSLLLVVALIAVLVAIVGSGNADRLLAGTSFDIGFQKNIVDFIGGTSTLDKSK